MVNSQHPVESVRLTKLSKTNQDKCTFILAYCQRVYFDLMTLFYVYKTELVRVHIKKRSTTQNKLFIKKYILTPIIIKGITRPPKKQQDFGRNVRPSFAGNIIVGELPGTEKPKSTKSFIPPQQPKSNFVPNLAAAGLRTTPR